MAAYLNNIYSFGEFELDADRRLLLKRGEPVALRSKTLDLLLVLIENNGTVMSRDELLDRVWKDQFVEENNLSVHIAALRKIFGETKNENRYIVTVPGSGYRFVAPLENGDREVVVETHSVKRIVVDSATSTIQESDSPALTHRQSRSWLWLGAPVLVLVGLLGWALLPGDAHPTNSAFSAPMRARNFPITAGIPQRVALAPDGKTLAYSRRLKGKDSLWISDTESGSTIQITEDLIRLHDAIEFSPDGRTIFFTAKDDAHRDWTLMSVPTFGGAPKDLVSGVRGDIGLSPDGRSVAYFKLGSGPETSTLYLADSSDGRNERQLLAPEGKQKFVTNIVSWKPGKGLITVALSDDAGAGCNFADVDPSNGAVQIAGVGLCEGVGNFAWFRDGSGLAVTEKSDGSGESSRVTFVDPASPNKKTLLDNGDRYLERTVTVADDGRVAMLEIQNYPGVSIVAQNGSVRSILQSTAQAEGSYGLTSAPDGKIVYTIRRGGARAIWEMEADGSKARELVAQQPEKEDVQINVSPDNRFIVFESNRSGSSEVWRANRDGSNLVMLTAGGENAAPTISPDGRQILYMSKRDGKYNIWRLPIEGGTAERLTSSDCSWPDVSPDGKQFACATGTTIDGASRMIDVYPIDGGTRLQTFAVTTSSALYNRIRWSADGRSIVYKDIAEGLWQQNVDGTPPVRMPGFDDIRIFHFRFQPDGTLLYSGGPQQRSIVILEKAA